MKPVQIVNVAPSLPKKLQPLLNLAYNLRWCWNHDVSDLFRRIDRDLWDAVDRNPIPLLGKISQDRLEEILDDDSIMSQLDRTYKDFNDYMSEKKTWFGSMESKIGMPLSVAYFSLEFGINESIPIYSGGLGMLAGDHLKSASDLGIPLCGVGLLYQEGYFRQYLNADGWQQEQYIDNDFYNIPVKPIIDKLTGKQMSVTVDYPTGAIKAALWRVDVGRVPLFLLDTNVPDNRPEDRPLTARLYGGDTDTRIRQEILLGIGGYKALKALNINPLVCHMNEGHSAFMALERIRHYMDRHKGLSFWEAHSLVRASTVFTTHTPVPAGNDVFPPDMVLYYFQPYLQQYNIPPEHFLGLGRQNPADKDEPFCMTVLAIKQAAFINGVSALHGEVSRKMWRDIWPVVPEKEIPITSVTNGVHLATWVSKEMTDLLTRYLGPKWIEDPAVPELWDRVDRIPAEELWRTHERRRERLVAFARQRLEAQLRRQGATETEIIGAKEVLSPEALTIGFARRFATYKRGALLFRDVERLKRILTNRDRPVQIIFAGKAHPRDTQGKELIRNIVHAARLPEFRHNVVFLENYDMFLARYMVQGVDVWLNTPRRPLEASGTSGMKASANGVLNISVLDGWWCEAYDPQLGWAVGNGEVYEDENYQDAIEADSLYDLLEKSTIPLFYNRSSDGLPRGWIDYMKRSITAIAPQFNTNRMVKDYFLKAYVSCAQRRDFLAKDDCAEARKYTAWKDAIRREWDKVKITGITSTSTGDAKVGDSITVDAKVDLASLDAGDVLVEIIYGYLNAEGKIVEPDRIAMEPTGKSEGSSVEFKGVIKCKKSGRHGHTVRVMPKNKVLDDPFKMGLITWGA